jgi:hypothetical protein
VKIKNQCVEFTVKINYEHEGYVDRQEFLDCLENAIEHCRQENMLTDLYDVEPKWVEVRFSTNQKLTNIIDP